MDYFWLVTLFHLHTSQEERELIDRMATESFQALGIEEFSLSEKEVDAILGERSYSGGDLPDEVLDEVEQKVKAGAINYRVFFNEESNASKFVNWIQQRALCETQVEKCPGEDWNAEWKKHYSPILVSDQLEIIPAWLTDYQSFAQHHLYINPGMGFGTGSHETTFLCLKLLVSEAQLNPKRVLDFGSGSGILGLATFSVNPSAQIDFYDIEPEANKNCYQNAELNGLEQKTFRLLLPEFRHQLLPAYDLIFANILESILLQEKSFLVNALAQNGHLILSGLLLPQVDGIITAYQSSGLKLKRKLEKGDWAALLFEKV